VRRRRRLPRRIGPGARDGGRSKAVPVRQSENTAKADAAAPPAKTDTSEQRGTEGS